MYGHHIAVKMETKIWGPYYAMVLTIHFLWTIAFNTATWTRKCSYTAKPMLGFPKFVKACNIKWH